jgi:hypothetical protein
MGSIQNRSDGGFRLLILIIQEKFDQGPRIYVTLWSLCKHVDVTVSKASITKKMFE